MPDDSITSQVDFTNNTSTNTNPFLALDDDSDEIIINLNNNLLLQNSETNTNTLQYFEIEKISNVFSLQDDLIWGTVYFAIYEEQQPQSELPSYNALIINKLGVSYFHDIDISSNSIYYPAVENVLPTCKNLIERKCLAVTLLKSFTNLSKDQIKLLKNPVINNLEYDNIYTGELASKAKHLSNKKMQIFIKRLNSLSLLQNRQITSTLYDVIYESTENKMDLNNRLVFHLGEQLEQLFNPLTEYSPEQTEYTYKQPDTQPPTQEELMKTQPTIYSICDELLTLQTNFTLLLVEFLQKFLITLRVEVLNDQIPNLSTIKLNRLFPPTIDEVTRINCIFLDSLRLASPYGPLEILKACNATIPYFYKAYTRHEAATKNFNKDIKLFFKNFAKRIPNPEIYTEMKIDTIINGPQEKLMKIKLILDRLWNSNKDWNKDINHEAYKYYSNTIEIIDSFGRLEGPLSSYNTRVFTPSGKILTELAKGWPQELQYKWLKRRVVGVFDIINVIESDTKYERQLLVIFSDYLVFLDILDSNSYYKDDINDHNNNQQKNTTNKKPLLSDILMNSLINEVPLPPKIPKLVVKNFTYIDNVSVSIFNDYKLRFDILHDSNDIDYSSYSIIVKLLSSHGVTSRKISDLITKATILEKETAFHLFKAIDAKFDLYCTAHELNAYVNERIKSKFAIFLNLSPNTELLQQSNLYMAIFLSFIDEPQFEMIKVNVITIDGHTDEFEIHSDNLIEVLLDQLKYSLPRCYSSVDSSISNQLVDINKDLLVTLLDSWTSNLNLNTKNIIPLNQSSIIPTSNNIGPANDSTIKDHKKQLSYGTITTFRSYKSDIKDVDDTNEQLEADNNGKPAPEDNEIKTNNSTSNLNYNKPSLRNNSTLAEASKIDNSKRKRSSSKVKSLVDIGLTAKPNSSNSSKNDLKKQTSEKKTSVISSQRTKPKNNSSQSQQQPQQQQQQQQQQQKNKKQKKGLLGAFKGIFGKKNKSQAQNSKLSKPTKPSTSNQENAKPVVSKPIVSQPRMPSAGKSSIENDKISLPSKPTMNAARPISTITTESKASQIKNFHAPPATSNDFKLPSDIGTSKSTDQSTSKNISKDENSNSGLQLEESSARIQQTNVQQNDQRISSVIRRSGEFTTIPTPIENNAINAQSAPPIPKSTRLPPPIIPAPGKPTVELSINDSSSQLANPTSNRHNFTRTNVETSPIIQQPPQPEKAQNMFDGDLFGDLLPTVTNSPIKAKREYEIQVRENSPKYNNIKKEEEEETVDDLVNNRKIVNELQEKFKQNTINHVPFVETKERINNDSPQDKAIISTKIKQEPIEPNLEQMFPVIPKPTPKKSTVNRSASFRELFEVTRLVLDENDAKFNWKRLPSDRSLALDNVAKRGPMEDNAFKNIAAKKLQSHRIPAKVLLESAINSQKTELKYTSPDDNKFSEAPPSPEFKDAVDNLSLVEQMPVFQNTIVSKENRKSTTLGRYYESHKYPEELEEDYHDTHEEILQEFANIVESISEPQNTGRKGSPFKVVGRSPSKFVTMNTNDLFDSPRLNNLSLVEEDPANISSEYKSLSPPKSASNNFKSKEFTESSKSFSKSTTNLPSEFERSRPMRISRSLASSNEPKKLSNRAPRVVSVSPVRKLSLPVTNTSSLNNGKRLSSSPVRISNVNNHSQNVPQSILNGIETEQENTITRPFGLSPQKNDTSIRSSMFHDEKLASTKTSKGPSKTNNSNQLPMRTIDGSPIQISTSDGNLIGFSDIVFPDTHSEVSISSTKSEPIEKLIQSSSIFNGSPIGPSRIISKSNNNSPIDSSKIHSMAINGSPILATRKPAILDNTKTEVKELYDSRRYSSSFNDGLRSVVGTMPNSNVLSRNTSGKTDGSSFITTNSKKSSKYYLDDADVEDPRTRKSSSKVQASIENNDSHNYEHFPNELEGDDTNNTTVEREISDEPVEDVMDVHTAYEYLDELDFSSFDMTFGSMGNNNTFLFSGDETQYPIHKKLQESKDNTRKNKSVKNNENEGPIFYRIPKINTQGSIAPVSKSNKANKKGKYNNSNTSFNKTDDDAIWVSPSKLELYDINKLSDSAQKRVISGVHNKFQDGILCQHGMPISESNMNFNSELSYAYLGYVLDSDKDEDSGLASEESSPQRLVFT
ncbi:hypothetical protein TBLA_0C01280 [Henningerozyma blattae CBS 6284]|uniref:DH domain-containing protein n=1 Tax=Henningerozyma blattae (strain ATCC 34711 / CBS 6284 / DSM 70876 / NBRC 10599 / NRRL Y-10934 / UCD 77-7) TaxID=1071380 RepID=I2H0P1_HENB6|nr:hypothetical protein TBLA_0C01280 [Tetrapisispora blattae CBS 6284]CCH59943.1 hypothetical protein TBLA_0C01280 [Tetrapisispora blattae CBS 6284]